MRGMSATHGTIGSTGITAKMPQSINKRWFQQLIADKGLTQAEVARALSLLAPALTRVFNGERRLQMQEAIDLARILDVPLDDVLVNAGIAANASRGPTAEVHGSVNADGTIRPAGGSRRRTTPAPEEGLVALDVSKFRWTVFYRATAGVSPDAIGRLAVVQTARTDDPMRLMMLDRGSRSGLYNLQDPADSFKEVRDVRLMSACPVLWVRT